jgi:hypothetical protein
MSQLIEERNRQSIRENELGKLNAVKNGRSNGHCSEGCDREAAQSYSYSNEIDMWKSIYDLAGNKTMVVIG